MKRPPRESRDRGGQPCRASNPHYVVWNAISSGTIGFMGSFDSFIRVSQFLSEVAGFPLS